MWVKAQDGSLVNLDHTAVVSIKKGEGTDIKIVAVLKSSWDSLYDITYNIGNYPTERKARNVMNAIARGIMEESKLFYMPQEAVKHDGD